MSTAHEKLAASLAALKALQKSGPRVIQSRQLSRVHRERLLANGFLQEVMKGWLIPSSPGVPVSDSTSWYASFWDFCGRYSSERFGDDWHLSPEQSLLLFAESSVIPKQLVVCSPRGTNHNIELPFGTSLYDLKQATMPGASDVIVRNGLRLFSPSAALVKVPESFFGRQPIEAQVAVASVRDASDLLRILLTGGNSVKAGVLAAALRRVGRPELADEVVKAMKAAGYDVREHDPFERAQTFSTAPQAVSPIVVRMQAIWTSMRDVVAASFPAAPGLPEDKRVYLELVDDIYKSDAYHSLSIG